jgi:hypothetical protein
LSLAVCVFCGSRPGRSAAFAAAARELGTGLGRQGWRLVYGGGDVGLMGIVADAALRAGGEVLGVIPQRLLDREVGKRDVSELLVTETMFDRKERMIERADAFVALPGGLGTLDELLEVVTLRQLGWHDRPIILVDIDGYWQSFAALVERVVESGFADPSAGELVRLEPTVEATLRALAPERAEKGTRSL